MTPPSNSTNDWYNKNREKYLNQKRLNSATKDKDVLRSIRQSKRSKNPRHHILIGAKAGAKRRNLEFNIVESDINWVSHCPVFGYELIYCGAGRQDNSASLDRIDSTKGYIKGNVQIISWRANNLKKDASPQELNLLANFMSTNQPLS